MNNQKVCISKQATFIFGVLLLLVMYVFVAYGTMTNKTSTNSRAENTNQIAQSALSSPPPTELQQSSALKYKASRINSGDIELLGEPPQIAGTPTYAIYMKKTDGSLVHIGTFITSNEDIKNRFNNNYWTPQTPVSIEDIEASNDFLLYEVQQSP